MISVYDLEIMIEILEPAMGGAMEDPVDRVIEMMRDLIDDLKEEGE